MATAETYCVAAAAGGLWYQKIKLLLTSDLQAETHFDFRPDGLIMSMRLPLVSG